MLLVSRIGKASSALWCSIGRQSSAVVARYVRPSVLGARIGKASHVCGARS